MTDDEAFEVSRTAIIPTMNLVQGKYMQKNTEQIDPNRTVRVLEYTSPKGPGYGIIMRASKGGKTFEKSEFFGPESYRSHDWQEVVEE